MTNEFEQRKKDHIRLAMSEETQGLTSNQFSKISLHHNALPEIRFSDVTLQAHLLNHTFSSPHFISSMTAGHEDSFDINLRLALAAQDRNWLMAVGSQRRELTDPNAVSEWKEIRKKAPDAKLLSNIGILEVIQNPVESIVQLTENLNAIGLYIHLNPLQEVFQKNNHIDFSHGLKAIETVVKKIKVPVLVKEVGFGISADLVKKLIDIGVYAVDVSGNGGTHWGYIEALRHNEDAVERNAIAAFANWGSSTIDCLLACQQYVLFHPILASGGIRNGVESAKCLALGARAVGLAQPIMKAAMGANIAIANTNNSDTAEILKVMDVFDFQLKVAMFCSGIKRPEDFLHKKVWQCLN